jgi:hypothetical protein
MELGRGARLCLAFGGEEPSCYGCEDDDYEADDDAPAEGKDAVSKVQFLESKKRSVEMITRLPL